MFTEGFLEELVLGQDRKEFRKLKEWEQQIFQMVKPLGGDVMRIKGQESDIPGLVPTPIASSAHDLTRRPSL